MDAKITKTRLSRMLSYDWIKMVITAAVLIFVWMLVFTMTATALTPAQKFSVMNYVGNVSFSNGDFYKTYEAACKNGVFSYEVIETSSEDLSIEGSSASQILQARTAVEEGDVLFVADEYDSRDIMTRESKDENGNPQYEYQFGGTYLQSFLKGYFYQVYDVNEYLDGMRAFLAQYYEDGDYRSPGELNKQKIKDDFNARTKKDKRFKKSAARAQGEKDEIARIEKYREALVKFEWYLEEGVVALTETVIEEEYFNDGSDLKGTYSINLCPTLDKGGIEVDGKPAMENLMNAVACKPFVYDENGKLVYGDATAHNMNVCLFKFNGVGNGFQYECMPYIVYLIETYAHADVRCPEHVYA